LVRVRKRDGGVEEFVESKIRSGIREAGATAQEAERVTKDVVEKVAHRVEITSEELSEIVVRSTEKVNKKVAREFVRFRDAKLKAKKKPKP
jgi:transcriptional regulator NrdR family protein